MIYHKWLKQPPRTQDKEQLAKKKDNLQPQLLVLI
ncbi:hypothetical protein SAMN04487776_109122 [Priestia megaterium]|jgi:hypothetical protein|nr:hypothetical protein SAMN04487776_109122 [Priestia megaterium]